MLASFYFPFFHKKKDKKHKGMQEREEIGKERKEKKEEANEKRNKIPPPQEAWKKCVYLNMTDICRHFREFSTVHAMNKILQCRRLFKKLDFTVNFLYDTKCIP